MDGSLVVYEVDAALSGGVSGPPLQVLTEVSGLRTPLEMVVVRQHACVADNGLGLVVLDLADPEAPVVLTSIPLAGAALDVVSDGTTDTVRPAWAAAMSEVIERELEQRSARLEVAGELSAGRTAGAGRGRGGGRRRRDLALRLHALRLRGPAPA